MIVSRRNFLIGTIGALGGSVTLLSSPSKSATVKEKAKNISCLVDINLCTGCRKCEAACQRSNELPIPTIPFEDLRVLSQVRRPSSTAFTVVNRWVSPARSSTAFVKNQCFHCIDPACVSACLVGAMSKTPEGAVIYDAKKCIGCRYCMVACPFQIPSYEYGNALTPRVRKCNFCYNQLTSKGAPPACAKMCPTESILFGSRDELIKIGKERISGDKNSAFRKKKPYFPHIYGEREAGGTGWLYLADVPFAQLGFLSMPKKAPPRLTEKIQEGIFKHFIPPLTLGTLLGFAMHLFKSPEKIKTTQPRNEDNDG